MAKKISKEEKKEIRDAKKEDEDKIFAFLCYFICIVGVIIVLATKKERGDYSIYHAKQGFVLFIAFIVVAIASWILAFIPVLGSIIGVILWILLAVLWIIGMINSLTGKKVPLPIIGEFGEKFNF